MLDTSREGPEVTTEGGGKVWGYFIGPKQNRVFNEASIFDSPTLHVWSVGPSGKPKDEFYSRNIGVISPFARHERWHWYGDRLEN